MKYLVYGVFVFIPVLFSWVTLDSWASSDNRTFSGFYQFGESFLVGFLWYQFLKVHPMGNSLHSAVKKLLRFEPPATL